MMTNEPKRLALLLIEDDPGHVRLIQKNLRRANLVGPIMVFNDGRRGVDYLLGQGEFSDPAVQETLPSLILLDLNLPGLDGYQVLRCLKQNERTRQIPVIVLSTTDDPQEINKCYDLGCSAYITKPVEYESFSQAVQKLGHFLPIVKFPDGDE